MITYFQAIIIGLLQGVTELFPISSLGHSVLLPWVLNWNSILASESRGESFFLSFLVALHVATGLALFIFYRRTWYRIIGGFFKSIQNRKIDSPDGRLAWLLLAATIPAGLTGMVFEHKFRTLFAKPLAAIVFLALNGCILLVGDHYLRHKPARSGKMTATVDNVGRAVTLPRAMLIGLAQTGALFAGISRSGITMVSGLYSGLSHEDAARFSFLLATPIILGAGIYKLPDFFSNLDAGMRGPLIAGSLVTGIAAYLSVRFLDKYFQNKTLRPFAIYCLGIAGVLFVLGLLRGHF
jgi:undecaprenyl-diphosphatase